VVGSERAQVVSRTVTVAHAWRVWCGSGKVAAEGEKEGVQQEKEAAVWFVPVWQGVVGGMVQGQVVAQ